MRNEHGLLTATRTSSGCPGLALLSLSSCSVEFSEVPEYGLYLLCPHTLPFPFWGCRVRICFWILSLVLASALEACGLSSVFPQLPSGANEYTCSGPTGKCQRQLLPTPVPWCSPEHTPCFLNPPTTYLLVPQCPLFFCPLGGKEKVGLAWLWFFFFRNGLELTSGSVVPLRQPPVP